MKAGSHLFSSAAVCLLCLFAVVNDGLAAEAGGKPLFSFGAVADIQYADKDNSGKRHYRATPAKLEACVANLNARGLAFTVELGDIVDGRVTKSETMADFEKILTIWKKLTMPAHAVIGNHCLEALGETTLASSFGLEKLYYEFTFPSCSGWRFIVLDGKHLDNGVKQMNWFADRLKACKAEGGRAIVFCHYPLLEEAAHKHRLKDPKPVLAAMANAGCVALYAAGHDHAGGYAYTNGTHHITMKGMVESAGSTSYAVFDVYPDRIVETGFGIEPNRELKLK